ncbi:hypothetical protein STCU_03390 [Strigomonas culicis]|uniref:Uncharacterized protein n=1 Tax=Strigomonas culicis TaxID=28005 RepID=S9U1U6_9TRYP|nr:hypothetical protein STCU_07040 [Strigomonas culicis]EPY30826.1 hypothetical protein STCU_03873 [Strigomonas culicis]EPY31568.1 hypothetical protein STCU_03390 [Strigomonas culicis]|eukprot:EPY24717.1 hypothetical protein STCU_07040 [Strigomonas culicis]
MNLLPFEEDTISHSVYASIFHLISFSPSSDLSFLFLNSLNACHSMFAVSLSLGATSAYVSVAPVPTTPSPQPAPIRIVANAAGHRNTAVAAALTEQEVLFGDNALHCYPRQPQQVVPYLFLHAAASAAIADASTASESNTFLYDIVKQAASRKYKGHCALEEEQVGDTHRSRHGFAYDTLAGDETKSCFVSAEDLFIQFLNSVKANSIDGACSLSEGQEEQSVFLTIVVPRYAFPSASSQIDTESRESATEWIVEAVKASQLGKVTQHTSVLFSDEGALLAVDSASRDTPYFLIPPCGAPQLAPRPIPQANVLVVDWGSHALSLTLLHTRGGLLVQSEGATAPAYVCSTGRACRAPGSFFAATASCGGDAIDMALLERVVGQFMLKQRKMFPSASRALDVLQAPNSKNLVSCQGATRAREIMTEAIPSRALRRLCVLMEEKKVSLNTQQASGVTVEMEAFYEGMDLVDNMTLGRNKFEAAVRSEWTFIATFEEVLNEFCAKYTDRLTKNPISTVILSGGMCQIAVLAQGITQLVKNKADVSSSALFSPTLNVVDASVVGNGVGASEVSCVGGCLNSYFVAQVYRRHMAHKKVTRASMSKIQAMLHKELGETCEAAWEAVSTAAVEGPDCEDGVPLPSVEALSRNVFVYTGKDTSKLQVFRLQEAAPLPSEDLTLLFSQDTPLPCRVWTKVEEVEHAALSFSLFTDANAGTTTNGDSIPMETGFIRVRSVVEKEVRFNVQPKKKESALLACFTVTYSHPGEESSERCAILSILLVEAADGAVPKTVLPNMILAKHETVLC